MIAWRKSSHSGGGGATDCVELADFTRAVGIRDSKNPECGHLSISRTAFSCLLRRIKNDEYSTLR